MDNIFESFIENLVSECLQSVKFSFLPEREKKEVAQKLRDHFYSMTIDTLIDQLSDEQVNQIKDLDSKSKMEEKMAEFAASIPGFAFVLEDKLKAKMSQILQTGQIPASPAGGPN